MAIWIIARKDLRLLLRDRRALIILLAMPFIFILILGLSLGEGFGQKPDDRLRVSLVDLDRGEPYAVPREAVAWLALTPGTGNPLTAPALVQAIRTQEPWSKVVQRDLAQTAEIRIELVSSLAEAEALVQNGKRSAVLVFGPRFSERVSLCSFLSDGINPFYRDGVQLSELDAHLLVDQTQLAAAKIIEQVAQVTMFRVVLPWMIGLAFERLSEEHFIDMLCNQVHLPVPNEFRFLFALRKEKLDSEGKASLEALLRVAANRNQVLMSDYKQRVGRGVQTSLQTQFEKYNLTGKTWAALTRSEPRKEAGAEVKQYVNESGFGPLRRGAVLYQTLVPSYTVMFAFFLVLTVGWLFVSERRQGTLKRLKLAPVSRWEILLGKLVPCFGLSLTQGFILLGAGKLVFGMSWGPEPAWVLPVVFTTSLAAMGLALLVAALARTETQVAIYGTLLVLMLAGISGCLMPRALMPEEIKQLSLLTPHAWALDAYAQLLLNPSPNYQLVAESCGVLTGFGIGFIGLAGMCLKLE
jgi:ABC-2 type transport system permease protein